MSVTRDQSKAIMAVNEFLVDTCQVSSGLFGASTGLPLYQSPTTAETTVNGNVIDRLSPELGANYNVVDVFAYLYTTLGSTEADKELTLDCYLMHGSSGSTGDMVNLSSGVKASKRIVNTTAQTTPEGGWSTGVVRVQTTPATWDLSGANRYIMVALTPTKHKLTTESSGYEHARCGAVLVFRQADIIPSRASTGAFSTTTSTST